MDLSVIQINSRQYLVKPGAVVEVDKLLTSEKVLKVDQVLLSVKNGKVEIGKPFLKKNLEFEVLENSLGKIEDSEEMLANLGKGVFVKTKVLEKKLFVNIGSNVIVKKNIKEASESIQEQEKQIILMISQLKSETEKLAQAVLSLQQELQ